MQIDPKFAATTSQIRGQTPVPAHQLLTDLKTVIDRLLARDGLTSSDPGTPLLELGLNSLMLIDLKARILEDYSINLPLLDLIGMPSVHGLAEFILERMLATSMDSVPQATQDQVQADGSGADTVIL